MSVQQTVNCNTKIPANINEYNASAKGSLSLVTTIDEQKLTYLLSKSNLKPVVPYLEKCKDQDIFYKNILNNTPIILLLKRIIAEKDNTSNNIYIQIYKLLTGLDNFKIIYDNYLALCVESSKYSSINNKSNTTIYNKLTNNGQSSNELNSSLFEYFYTDLPLFPNIKQNSLDIINVFLTNNTTTTLTVFHGTNMKVHETTNTFTTYAFLSTTVDLNVARSYGEIIYIINIPANFPYINLGDDCNKQILLPIGTQINIENNIKDKIYFGTITNTENIVQTLNTIKCVLEQATTITQTQKTQTIINELPNIMLLDKPSKQINTQPIKKRRCSPCTKSFCKGTSTIKFYTDVNNVQYALKFGQHSVDNYNIRRMINEVFASRLYNSLGMRAFDHEIKKINNKYCIQSEFKDIKYRDPTPIEAEEYLSGYLWDCILANWDVGNKGNVGFLNLEENGKKIIRTDVGGALAYRARGEFKLSFFNNSEPKEHIFLLQQPFVKKCFKSISINYDNLVTLLYSNIKPIEYELIQTYINSLPPQYQNFITKIVDRVKERCNYYIKYQADIINQILSALNPPQNGGKNSLFLKYNSEICKIKTLKTDKYILVKNKRVFLKDIRGKYRYVKSGGGEDNVEVEDIDDEEYNLYDIAQQQPIQTLEKLLQSKKASCVTKQ
jgi:hypothetical protein